MANTLESIINLPKLNSESTLRELPLTDFQVSPMTSLELVEYQFNQQPDLSGVIVASDEKFFGMISRRYFHEQMSSRYGRELFIKRPIQYFLKATPTKYLDNCLVLLSEEKINLAVQIALNRSEETVYEPLVIQFVNKKNPNCYIYFLLNFQTLILAQSHLLREVNNELSRQKSSAKNYLIQLKHKQQKLQQHTAELQTQKQEILARHKLLEIQQNDLISQSQQIHNLNRRLKEITGFISQEGKKAFYATFEGVQKINKNMNEIVNIGHLFTNELKLINSASHQIETISKQAKHLAIQAAIVAGHSNSQLSGFSHITNEIGKLVNETSQAGRQMNLVANNLMRKISELNNLAETGKQTAQSLVENNQRSEITLDELEKLIQQPNLDRAAVNSSAVTQGSKITDISQENLYQDKNIVNNHQEKFEEKNTDLSELQMQILNNQKDQEKLIQ
ncbi:MAG: hypothetical protein F6K25_06055 [Okeania sp. SIO2G4]|uniref:hypothetical protein n=1 Tax=unclassified Okeania TaxID=2634635 RepID=UPI0013BDD3C6|nr:MULTISPECIES: hypothetical protein [unclassified Okeania]NEP41169.1 hypothetical protein [Okeania sp. SIO2H7]NEP70533.1 hypothetical protein [Okeania sp. SIO2G5]NEP92764.1 hypothetical protein [Okeania sp. SIO2F5]NEQ90307.1 hypothetical protein [Okeania sp. SIO2G4]